MTPLEGGRDGEHEAFVLDRYLESLLAREPFEPEHLPPDLRAAADRLATLPRFHPSFRFEEHLAKRLATAAAGEPDGHTTATGDIDAHRLIAFPAAAVATSAGRVGPVRPVVLGGVLTSAALSLAGAAYVAWRRSRPPADPMLRAVRAVARGRIA